MKVGEMSGTGEKLFTLTSRGILQHPEGGWPLRCFFLFFLIVCHFSQMIFFYYYYYYCHINPTFQRPRSHTVKWDGTIWYFTMIFVGTAVKLSLPLVFVCVCLYVSMCEWLHEKVWGFVFLNFLLLVWRFACPLKEHSFWAVSSSWRSWRPACSWWGSTLLSCCATFPRRSRSWRPCTSCGSTSRWGWQTCRHRTTSQSCSTHRSFQRGTCHCHGRGWRRTSGRGWSACWNWWHSQLFHCKRG